ncbi:P-loop containing nucleoside triphosphate hydrolase protein [Cercophora newfieldiana]|uniref:ATP-dependent RNA helicase n=1 Tax=Cercophora newfieldiana TaxID=92897 RepID=A0AA39YJ17_9PEZI|nr:P-loop containing nucleoside triphosphate hydrolase protein [Cercophora newfieldiana]
MENPQPERVTYASMAGRIHPQLLKALEQMQYTHMTPVQEKTLHLPSFTDDCLVQAKTGTGKTIAFLLPALHTLLNTKNLKLSQVSLLVLAPTRELAQQIADECDKLTSLCKPALECHIAVGGSKRAFHLNKFLKGSPSILVATPGRLIDYLSEPAAKDKFSDLRCLVLDEADRMLDQGFMPDLLRILKQIPSKSSAGWQGMCFSATIPPEINKVLHFVLYPGHHRISTIDENETPTVDAIPQSVIPVKSIDDVLPTLHSLLACERLDNPSLKAVIFSSTARQAGLLYNIFGFTGGAAPGKLPVFQMHSRMGQASRNRTVEEFKAATQGLLFASDVVGRGMDFPDIGLVVQIGLTTDKDQYVHRVGRTGRAGKTGRAVMIMTPEDMPFVRKNPQFPIKTVEFTHPKAATIPSAEIIQKALEKVPLQTKEQAYVAFLGFTKALKKIHGLDAPLVVKLANRFSESLGLEEPPALEPSTVGKMGLKGVPGLTIKRGASGRGAGGNGGGNRGSGRKQPLDDSTPSTSASGSRGPRPPAGEPRHKRPKRETRGQGSA